MYGIGGAGFADRGGPRSSSCSSRGSAGTDGLVIEVHPDPEEALSDGRQSLTLEAFSQLMHDLRRVAVAVDRFVGEAPAPLEMPVEALTEIAK